MNERIKQLAEQACVTVLTTKGMEDIVDGCYIVSPDKLDEFVELIVQECVRKVRNRGGMCGALASNWIEEHFYGVDP